MAKKKAVKKKAVKKKAALEPPTVGEQVKAGREKALLSQYLLAEELGLSIQTIRSIEQDVPSSRMRILQNICDLTGHRIIIEPRGRSRG